MEHGNGFEGSFPERRHENISDSIRAIQVAFENQQRIWLEMRQMLDNYANMSSDVRDVASRYISSLDDSSREMEASIRRAIDATKR